MSDDRSDAVYAVEYEKLMVEVQPAGVESQ